MIKNLLLGTTLFALGLANLNAQNTVTDPLNRLLLNEFTTNGLTDYIANVGQPFVYDGTAGNYQAELAPNINDKKYLFWGVQSQATNTIPNFNFSNSQLAQGQKFVVRAQVHAPNAGEDNVDFSIHITNYENINAIETPNDFPAFTGIKTFIGPEYNLTGVNTPTTYQYDITPILPFVTSRNATVAFRATNKAEGEKSVILDNLEFGIQPPTTASAEIFFKQNFRFYPNPVQNVLNIVSVKNIEIKGGLILDINGRIIKSFKGSVIDVNELQSALYIVNLETNQGIGSFKFVKN